MPIQITRGKKIEAQRVCIYGPEGVGKSTLAAQLDRPLFIDAERGTLLMDVSRIEVASMSEVRDACNLLLKGGHDFGTLVLDTIDWVERQLAAEIAETANKDSIEDFGYGKGYKLLEEKTSEFLALLDKVRAKGIHVVFLAHSKVIKFEEPDKGGSYDRYELKLEKKTAPLIKEWCDALLFLNFVTKIVERSKGSEAKRAVGGDERQIFATRNAAYDAKNRHGLDGRLPANVAALSPIFGMDAKAAAAPIVEQAHAQASETPSLDESFKAIAEALGVEKVCRFLASKNLDLLTLTPEFMQRAVDRRADFERAVNAAG